VVRPTACEAPVVRALVVGNRDGLDGGFVVGHLRTCGYRFTDAHREGPGDWPDLDGVDLVVTLGSEWHVYRPETAAPVEAEAALVRDVTARGIPLLAICFGAQVLSHALGGTVVRTDRPEIGWYEPVPASGAPAVAAGPWMEWHDDVFTAPAGFEVLASTPSGPQLIAGGRAVGTQFHPEATETMVRDWIEHGGAEQLRARGGDPDELLAATRRNTTASRPAAEALVDWFLARTATGA
jgi:GMP synthase-like glutamine amidotransferase